jgi:hypothetical protein
VCSPIEDRIVDALTQYRTIVTRRCALTVLAGGMSSAVAGGAAPATSDAGTEPDDRCCTAVYRESEHVSSYYAVCRLREPPC